MKIRPDFRSFLSSDLAAIGFLGALSLALACHDIEGTGAMWPDGPRYATAGSMIRDWLASGELLHPFRYAVNYYTQYPGFSVPFHPPAYPGLLGVFFLITGVSYGAARVFIGLCLASCGALFYMILRRFDLGRATSLGCSTLFLTTPEVVLWSRCTMSEVPSLAFALAGSYTFLAWSRTGRTLHYWAAILLAEIAFLCRTTTSGILPAWFLFAALTGNVRRLLSTGVIAAAVLYLAVNAAFVYFVSGLAKYEVAADGRGYPFAAQHFSYFADCVPSVLTTGTALAALAGIACVASSGAAVARRATLFWFCWGASFCLFKLAVPTSSELRHFFLIWPALAGLASGVDGQGALRPLRRWIGIGILGIGLGINASQIAHLPRGVVGYDEVARRLADRDRPGNLLLACDQFQDLIFRLRAADPSLARRLYRSDRTLAVRLSSYANVSANILAQSPDDVLAVVRRGRIRYLVTCAPADPSRDDRPAEMVLAHQTALSRPESFRLISEHDLTIQFPAHRGQAERPERKRVFLWEFTGEIPPGPSELPSLVPTAGLVIE